MATLVLVLNKIKSETLLDLVCNLRVKAETLECAKISTKTSL